MKKSFFHFSFLQILLGSFVLSKNSSYSQDKIKTRLYIISLLIGFISLTCFVNTALSASSTKQFSKEQVLYYSDVVIIGKVISKNSFWAVPTEAMIGTTYDIQIIETVAGIHA